MQARKMVRGTGLVLVLALCMQVRQGLATKTLADLGWEAISSNGQTIPAMVDPYTGFPMCLTYDGSNCLWNSGDINSYPSGPIIPLIPYRSPCSQLQGCGWPCDICAQYSQPNLFQLGYRNIESLGSTVPARVNPDTGYPECATYDGANCLWGTPAINSPPQALLVPLVPYKVSCESMLKSGCAALGGTLWPCDVCAQYSLFTYFTSSDLHMGGNSDYAGNPVDIPARINDIVGGVSNVCSTGRANCTGYIINGDLTHYYQVIGGDDTVADIYNVLDNNTPAMAQYRGMGNHDFGINVDDAHYECGAGYCWGVGAFDQFGSAARAIRDLQWGNYKFRQQQQPGTVLSIDYSSGAYHWAEQGWSFIMLHRNPYHSFGQRCYPPIAGPCACVCAGQYSYDIESTMNNGWLAGQLQAATSAGRKIVLFIHQMAFDAGDKSGLTQNLWSDGPFQQLVGANSVVGIYTGHTHDPEWLGFTLGTTNIPVINSGASWYNMFLQTEFFSSSYTVGIREVPSGNPGATAWMKPGTKGPQARYVNTVQATYQLQLLSGVWKVISF